MGTWRPVTLQITDRQIADRWGPLPPHADPPPRRVLRWLERGGRFYFYLVLTVRELDKVLASVTAPEAPGAPTGVAPARVGPAPRSTIGRIDIPRLGVSAVVRAGSDARTLRLAVGHIAGTSLPGEPGNVGLAAHRDTFFRRLRDIRPDDEIIVTTPEGTFRYSVSGTKIVSPTDVWVLDATERPALTLVTCYPFSYVGRAPQRFVVRANSSR